MNFSTTSSRRTFLRRTMQAAAAGLLAPTFHIRAAEAAEIWRTGNDTIDRAREIAIGLLKPTPAQLQRAWELHAASLVFDAYGFAPRAAFDGARFQATVEAGAGN